MESYKYVLLENTFDIDKDVDYIYNSIFKEAIDKLKNKTFNDKLNVYYNFLSLKGDLLEFIESNSLSTKECRLAHSINPIYIFGGFFTPDSFYCLTKKIKGKNYILISIDKDLIESYVNNNFDFGNLKREFPNKYIQLIKNTLKESNIKSLIYHEVSHWLNDTLNSNHIQKIVQLAQRYDNPELLKLKTKNINLTYFEIDGQVHSIKQCKRDNLKKWDKLTFYQLFLLMPGLWRIYMDVKEYGPEITNMWLQTLVKRMNRENLLGRSMRLPFKDSFDIN